HLRSEDRLRGAQRRPEPDRSRARPEGRGPRSGVRYETGAARLHAPGAIPEDGRGGGGAGGATRGGSRDATAAPRLHAPGAIPEDGRGGGSAAASRRLAPAPRGDRRV